MRACRESVCTYASRVSDRKAVCLVCNACVTRIGFLSLPSTRSCRLLINYDRGFANTRVNVTIPKISTCAVLTNWLTSTVSLAHHQFNPACGTCPLSVVPSSPHSKYVADKLSGSELSSSKINPCFIRSKYTRKRGKNVSTPSSGPCSPCLSIFPEDGPSLIDSPMSQRRQQRNGARASLQGAGRWDQRVGHPRWAESSQINDLVPSTSRTLGNQAPVAFPWRSRRFYCLKFQPWVNRVSGGRTYIGFSMNSICLY